MGSTAAFSAELSNSRNKGISLRSRNGLILFLGGIVNSFFHYLGYVDALTNWNVLLVLSLDITTSHVAVVHIAVQSCEHII